MSSVSIVGLGDIARVLATRVVAGGNRVQVIGGDAANAAALADELGGAV